jgi:predicted amidophosphoribosyltransferase
MYSRSCWECGKKILTTDQICPDCGFDFNSPAYIKPICPYCEKELHLDDFNVNYIDKKGRIKPKGFKGEFFFTFKMFYCPFCGKILGFCDSDRGT